MNPVLFLAIFALLFGGHYALDGRIPAAVPFLILAALLYGWYAWKKDPKHATPSFVLWLAPPVALAAGWEGSYLLKPVGDYARGLPLFLLAAWALTVPFPETFPVLKPDRIPAERKAPEPALPGRLLLAALLGWVLMMGLFYSRHFIPGLVGLAAVLLILVFLRRKREETLKIPPLASEGAWLLLVLAAAALARYPFAGHLFTGFQNDAATEAYGSILAIRGRIPNFFDMSYYYTATFPFFLEGQVVRWTGHSLPAMQAISMTLSMAAILVFNRWCRLYFGPRATLLATALFALSWWHLFYAFLTFTVIYTLVFELCAFYFLERGLREGRKPQFFWAGVFTAASVMTYNPGRTVPLMAAFFLAGYAYFAGGSAFVRTYRKPLALYALSFLWFFSPFLRFILLQPHDFFLRTREVNIFKEVARTGDILIPVKTTLWTLLSFVWGPGIHVDFGLPNNPLIDPLSGFLLAAGLVLTFTGLHRRAGWAALGGFFAGILANSLTGAGPDPILTTVHPMRMFFMFPFVMLLAARGAEWAWAVLDRSGRPMKTVLTGLLALFLAGSIAFNVRLYYFKFRDRQDQWSPLGFRHVGIGRECRRLMTSHHLVFDDLKQEPIVNFFSDLDTTEVVRLKDLLPLPIRCPVEKDMAVITRDRETSDAVKSLLKLYPRATVEDHKNPWGDLDFQVVRIPKDEIVEARKGLKPGPPVFGPVSTPTQP